MRAGKACVFCEVGSCVAPLRQSWHFEGVQKVAPIRKECRSIHALLISCFTFLMLNGLPGVPLREFVLSVFMVLLEAEEESYPSGLHIGPLLQLPSLLPG